MNRCRSLPFLLLLLTACASSKATEKTATDTAKDAMSAATSDIKTEEVSYTEGDLTMKGFIAYDASKKGPRPGVLIVHEWWGHNDYVRSRAKQLAAMGYVALAVDMYGDGKTAEHPDDAGKFAMAVMSDAEGAKARFLAAEKVLIARPETDKTKVAAIGYCFGGGVVLSMARQGVDLAGVASFHGMLGTQSPAAPGAVKTKILVLHGGADPFVPAEQVAAFKKEMDAAGAAYDFVEYPGVVHGFTNPGATAVGKKFELPLQYNAEADADSWLRLDKFLKEIFAAS